MTPQGNPNKRSSVHITEVACKIASQNIIRRSIELRKKQKNFLFKSIQHIRNMEIRKNMTLVRVVTPLHMNLIL